MRFENEGSLEKGPSAVHSSILWNKIYHAFKYVNLFVKKDLNEECLSTNPLGTLDLQCTVDTG